MIDVSSSGKQVAKFIGPVPIGKVDVYASTSSHKPVLIFYFIIKTRY